MQLGIGPAAAMHAAENLYLQGYLFLFFRHNKQGYLPVFLRHSTFFSSFFSILSACS